MNVYNIFGGIVLWITNNVGGGLNFLSAFWLLLFCLFKLHLKASKKLILKAKHSVNIHPQLIQFIFNA